MYSQHKVVKKCNSCPLMKSFQILCVRDGQLKYTQCSGWKLMWYHLKKKTNQKAKALQFREQYVVFQV